MLDVGARTPPSPAWRVGRWLLTPFLQSIEAEAVGRLRARVAAELTTTCASTYTRQVSLAGMLKPDAFHAYVKRTNGEKFLVTRRHTRNRDMGSASARWRDGEGCLGRSLGSGHAVTAGEELFVADGWLADTSFRRLVAANPWIRAPGHFDRCPHGCRNH